MEKARTTYRTVMHPSIKRQEQRTWTMTDYVSVPRLATMGTYKVRDMLSDASMRKLISHYRRARVLREWLVISLGGSDKLI